MNVEGLGPLPPEPWVRPALEGFHSIAAAAAGKTEGSEMELLTSRSRLRNERSWKHQSGWGLSRPHTGVDRENSQSEANSQWTWGLQHKARRMPPQLGGGWGETVLPLWALVQDLAGLSPQ